MNITSYFIWKIRQKLCRIMHINHIFKTKMGVKGIYGIAPTFKVPIASEILLLSAQELYLGVDLLCNDYTLLGCPLMDSPHFFFMNAIAEGKSLKDTDYIIRYKNGCLDGRIGSYIRDYNKFETIYSARVTEIINNMYTPVLVYQIGGKFYIYDGKHRAALLALYKCPIKCYMVDNNFFGGAFDLIKENANYSKHRDLYNLYLKEKTI